MSTGISTDLTSKIVESAQEANATDIVVLDLRGLTILADYFVIASGRSTIQVKSIAERIEDQLLEQGEKPLRREGFNEGRWIILDYSGVMVHIFRQEERILPVGTSMGRRSVAQCREQSGLAIVIDAS